MQTAISQGLCTLGGYKCPFPGNNLGSLITHRNSYMPNAYFCNPVYGFGYWYFLLNSIVAVQVSDTTAVQPTTKARTIKNSNIYEHNRK
jgi:hypothetical protein